MKGSTNAIPRINTSNLVDLNSEQTITGLKTIKSDELIALKLESADSNNSMTFRFNYLPEINSSNHLSIVSGSGMQLQAINDSISIYSPLLQPQINNQTDLGSVSKLFKNLYLSGNISDGTNNVTIADIITKQSIQTYIDEAINGALEESY